VGFDLETGEGFKVRNLISDIKGQTFIGRQLVAKTCCYSLK
jgi:hypothetical protein